MPSGQAWPSGSRASAWASAGTAATAVIATLAAAANFFACDNGQITGISFDGGYAEYMIAPASAVALMPGGTAGRRCGPADVRRRDHVQRAAQQRRPAGRRGGRAGSRRARAIWACNMPRRWAFTPSASPADKTKQPLAKQLGAPALHRQPGAGSGRGTAKAGRRQSHPGHGHQRRGDERRARRLGRQWHAAGHRAPSSRCKVSPIRAAQRSPLGQGLVFRACRSTRRTRWRSARAAASGR